MGSKIRTKTRLAEPAQRVSAGAGIGGLPGRHVVLGLCLAELANGAGYPLRIDFPAVDLSWSCSIVLIFWLLKQTRTFRNGETHTFMKTHRDEAFKKPNVETRKETKHTERTLNISGRFCFVDAVKVRPLKL